MPHGRSHGDTRMSAELRYLRRALYKGARHSLKAELGGGHGGIIARGALPRLKLSLWRLSIDARCLRRVHAGLGEDARFHSDR